LFQTSDLWDLFSDIVSDIPVCLKNNFATWKLQSFFFKAKWKLLGKFVTFLNKILSTLCVFADLLIKLHILVGEPNHQYRIKEAKAVVLAAYFNHSGSRHGQKIKRVQNTLCESVRRRNEILTNLLERKVITLSVYESIKSETTAYKQTNLLLDVLSAGPVSSYQCFLEALDDSDQHHLHCLLEDKGSYLYMPISRKQNKQRCLNLI